MGEDKETKKNVGVDLAGGWFGGALQAVVGHPLDTIKVRLQNQAMLTGADAVRYKGTVDCAKQILQQEGARGFYKGLSTPLWMNGVCMSVLYSANTFVRQGVADARGKQKISQLSLGEIVVSAWLAAPVYCLFVAPTDLIKTQLQVQAKSAVPGSHRGPWDVVKTLVRNHGIGGMFRGYQATVAMRWLGHPIYFGGYEATKRALSNGEDATTAVAFAAGCVAGLGFWAACYPVDTIKTQYQGHKGPDKPQVLQLVRNLMRQQGIAGFYRGITPCLLRSVPANAASFMGLEWTRMAWKYSQEEE